MGSEPTARGVALIVAAGGTLSGREIVTLLLANGLREAGWRIHVLVSSWSNGDFGARLQAQGFEYDVLPLGFFSLQLRGEPLKATLSQAVRWPALARGYNSILRSLAPDVVIHTDWQHASLLLPWMTAKRDIYWSHEIIPDRLHYHSIFRAIQHRTRWIVGVSRAVIEALTKAGLPAAGLAVVYNGIPADFDARPPCGRAPLRLGIVGQIADWKGHDLAIEAIALLAEGEATLHIFGAGAPAYVAALREKAIALGVAHRIEWRGFVADKSDIYGEIDVCLVPSQFEDPLPTVAIEAGIAGRPVVCSRCGGLPEIVQHGETGFHADTPEQIAIAISRFTHDPCLVQKMGAAASKRVLAEFSYATFVERFDDLLQGSRSMTADA